jgi:hypothetical protein
MKQLNPQELAQFARGFRFAGGQLRRVRVLVDGGGVAVEFGLGVHAAVKDLGKEGRPVRLKVRLEGVSEYRFQKRMNSRVGRVSDVKFGYFDGLLFVNLDAWGLQPGEVPGVHDFRASDVYAAGKVLRWEEVAPPANRGA